MTDENNTYPTFLERMQLHSDLYVDRFESFGVDRIARLVKRIELQGDWSVVDFGCGNAMLLECLHDRIGRYVGVDFSPRFIEASKQRQARLDCEHAEFYCGSIQSFCAENVAKFDACFAFDLSEHVPDGEWAEIVHSMYACLRPGGIAYLHTPNLDFFIERMKSINFILKQFPEHIAVRTAAENMAFFKGAGFDPVQLDYLPHYNILRIVHLFRHIPVFGKFFRARIFISAVKPGGLD